MLCRANSSRMVLYSYCVHGRSSSLIGLNIFLKIASKSDYAIFGGWTKCACRVNGKLMFYVSRYRKSFDQSFLEILQWMLLENQDRLSNLEKVSCAPVIKVDTWHLIYTSWSCAHYTCEIVAKYKLRRQLRISGNWILEALKIRTNGIGDRFFCMIQQCYEVIHVTCDDRFSGEEFAAVFKGGHSKGYIFFVFTASL